MASAVGDDLGDPLEGPSSPFSGRTSLSSRGEAEQSPLVPARRGHRVQASTATWETVGEVEEGEDESEGSVR